MSSSQLFRSTSTLLSNVTTKAPKWRSLNQARYMISPPKAPWELLTSPITELKGLLQDRANPSAWVHRLGSKTPLTENNNNHVIIFIISKNKFIRRTAVAIAGDTAVSLLNIFTVCIAAEIKSMDHRNWKNIEPRIPASEVQRNYFKNLMPTQDLAVPGKD